MSVEHGPPGVGTGVENEPVPTGKNALGLGYGTTGDQHLGKQVRSGRGQLKRVLIVLNRHNQHMRSGLGIDIPKRHSPLSAMHHSGRNLPTHDLTKQTRLHSTHSQRLIHTPNDRNKRTSGARTSGTAPDEERTRGAVSAQARRANGERPSERPSKRRKAEPEQTNEQRQASERSGGNWRAGASERTASEREQSNGGLASERAKPAGERSGRTGRQRGKPRPPKRGALKKSPEQASRPRQNASDDERKRQAADGS
jgi:hypothetical protein